MPVICRSTSNYQTEIIINQHLLLSDESLEDGGDDAGPSPSSLLLGALGACKVITAEMYARRKGWKLEHVEIRLDSRKVLAEECEDCVSAPGTKVEIIECYLNFEGDLTPEQITRLHEIANRCPVQRTLMGEIKVRTYLDLGTTTN
ncbi:MAG: OsmC family protein [Anaerolineae bacterium]